MCPDSDTPVQILSSTQSILINHIDTIADPAQLTNLSESELAVFDIEEDNEALEKTDITHILSQGAPRELTVDIQGSILMTTTISSAVHRS